MGHSWTKRLSLWAEEEGHFLLFFNMTGDVEGVI